LICCDWFDLGCFDVNCFKQKQKTVFYVPHTCLLKAMADKSYIIKVVLYSDACINLAVTASDTIGMVKTKIQDKTGDDAAHLIIKDQSDNILASSRTLLDYKIKKGCTTIASKMAVEFSDGTKLSTEEIAASVMQLEGGPETFPVGGFLSTYGENMTQQEQASAFEEMQTVLKGKGKGKGKSSEPFQGKGHRLDEEAEELTPPARVLIPGGNHSMPPPEVVYTSWPLGLR